MITRLRELRDHQHDKPLRSSYQAAIDRLDALAYRLKEAAARPRGVVGLPAPARSFPPPTPEPPQRTLPLGPVPLIVKARKPKRRDWISAALAGRLTIHVLGVSTSASSRRGADAAAMLKERVSPEP